MNPKSFASRLKRSLSTYGMAGAIVRAVWDVLSPYEATLRRWRDHRGATRLHGEPKGRDIGIAVLAGYKPALWPLTLARIRRFAPANAEVCVTTAGKHVPELAALCEQNGWTYLTTAANKTGLALNKVIEAHPAATRWFKLDEDIFVAEGFFEDMIAGYDALMREGSYRPGYCSPMLNVNGISYAGFLERLDATTAYHEAFGELRQAAGAVHAHYDPKAAEWLWRQTLPLDEVAQRIRGGSGGALQHARLIGTRFSIGAIYFERNFWEEIGGFSSTWRQGILGVDETGLCEGCMLTSRPMFYLTNVLAGHFSFYPQEKAMMALIPEFATIDPATFGPGARAIP
ncbi:MAG: hypothetical protein AAGC76_14990 [Luteibacter sp.]|uniref:hypothetical protein n=1 Tax=Luteibacter sp. TaxID=1886636 RepID=UPI0028067245|nr:hypothetical protein [Luteibacter sp.]MDQ7997143.1 hypothetical protein [Luteibacter sp.]MDQ8049793.1 hypothetical protein [Luteibacter sp.]